MAKSGRIIISLRAALEDGTTLCNDGGQKIARILEVIGPVSSPYASAVPLTNNIAPHIGKRLFALEEEEPRRDRRSERYGGRRR